MNNPPRWLIDKRFKTCQSCLQREGCVGSRTLFAEVPECPLNAHHSITDELKWELAWPQHAAQVSGCCDSALHPAL
jgi:hypothetical protein